MDESLLATLAAHVPTDTLEDADHPARFRALVDLLLNRVTLSVSGVPFRLTEVELYVHSQKHPDTFTHGDAMQRELGKWYFHRTAGAYRGGSFKGLDLAIGRPDAPSGVLVRGLERLKPSPDLIDGPSLCVDRLLALTGHADVASLAGSFDRGVTSAPMVLSLDATPRPPSKLFATARVGLSLKRGVTEQRLRYLARPYRFLSEPRAIKKGKLHLVIALHEEGLDPAAIAEVTGVAGAYINKYLALYAAGKGTDPCSYRMDLGAEALCKLLGALSG